MVWARNRINQDVSTGDNWTADVNGDGRVNILDLMAIRNNLNARCE
jgi:hypothetical protein